MEDQQVYNAEYVKHRMAGDDPMNARLRLIEQGASVEESLAAQEAFSESDDVEFED